MNNKIRGIKKVEIGQKKEKPVNFNSLFFIVFIVFGMTQAVAQICQQTISLIKAIDPKNEVVSGSPPNTPLTMTGKMSRDHRQFRTAYNKGEFIGDERYITHYSLFKLFGRSQRSKSFVYENFRITGVDKGDLVVDYIDQTGSIRSARIESESIDPLLNMSMSGQSKELFHRVEQSLAEVNFDSKNIPMEKGSKVDRLIFISDHLTNSPRVNPYKTHIADFEDQIDSHIEFIREGILSSGTDVDSKLKILDDFKKEAESKRDSKELTYQYWLLWNMRLSILVSSDKPTQWNWQSHQDTLLFESEVNIFLEEYDYWEDYVHNRIMVFLTMFPDFIIMPAIGPLGYKDFNKTFPAGIFLIELKNKNTVQDNQQMSPYYLYMHDMIHAVYGTYGKVFLPKIDDMQFSERYLKIAQTFPDKIREMAEIGHFIFFHEVAGVLQPSGNVQKLFRNKGGLNRDIYSRLRIENDLGAILPEEIQSDEEIKEYFKRVIDVFNRIYLQILVGRYTGESSS